MLSDMTSLHHHIRRDAAAQFQAGITVWDQMAQSQSSSQMQPLLKMCLLFLVFEHRELEYGPIKIAVHLSWGGLSFPT